MGAQLKPVGQAVALAKGHYPMADGRHVTVLPGQRFTLFEGYTKGKWFTVAPAAPAPKQDKKADDKGPETLAAAAAVERERKARVKPPTGDDLA